MPSCPCLKHLLHTKLGAGFTQIRKPVGDGVHARRVPLPTAAMTTSTLIDRNVYRESPIKGKAPPEAPLYLFQPKQHPDDQPHLCCPALRPSPRCAQNSALGPSQALPLSLMSLCACLLDFSLFSPAPPRTPANITALNRNSKSQGKNQRREKVGSQPIHNQGCEMALSPHQKHSTVSMEPHSKFP